MSKLVFFSKSVVLSSFTLLTMAMLSGALALAQTLPESPGQYSLDVYALRGEQDTSANLYVSVITNAGQSSASEAFNSVNVEVETPEGELVSQASYTNVVSSTDSPAVINLGDVPLSDVVLVHANGIAGPDAVPVVLNGMTAVTEFAVNSRKIVVPDFEGYGAELNQNLYTALSNTAKGWINTPPVDTANVEAKVKEMRPGLSRIFISKNNFLPGNQNLVDSFYKTVELAQAAGARVNITWQSLTHPSNKLTTEEAEVYIDTDMQNFAATVNDLVKNHGITAIKELTVQNEADSVAYIKANMILYEYAYRQLDMYLKQDGIRDQIKLVGGDLVLNGQAPFFLYMAQHMDDVLDGWSEHIYWNYYDSGYMITRLDGILAEMDTLKSEGYNTKPLSITEYGVRGHKTLNGMTIKDPDPYRNGSLVNTAAGYFTNSDGSLTPVNETNIAAYQQARFNMAAVDDGFIGMAKWDFYRAQYDFGYQDHSLIGYRFNPTPDQDRWPLRPAYYMEWLMANTTGRHWQVLAQSGSSGAKLITPFRGPNGELTLFAMNTDETAGAITVGDLPRGTEFQVLVWNGDGAGKVTDGGRVNAAGTGTVSVNVPEGGMVALTTMATATPPQ